MRALAVIMLLAWLVCGADPMVSEFKVRAAEPAGADSTAKLPRPLKRYKERVIAPTMTYHGAPWLTRDERDREENTALLLEKLNLKPGMTVCDLGCGNGYYTLELARMVGAAGKVLAVDIQPEMLHLLQERAKAAGIGNVELIESTPIDPKLPENSVDLILLVDVYHEFAYPVHMLRELRKSLTPAGRVALVEFRAEDPLVPIKPLHKMTKHQIMKEFPANGFKLAEQFDGLPWQHLMFFSRDDEALLTPGEDGDSESSEAQ
jgi:ubiquinone/menaquinone biosynthesis C-methylase UbiE